MGNFPYFFSPNIFFEPKDMPENVAWTFVCIAGKTKTGTNFHCANNLRPDIIFYQWRQHVAAATAISVALAGCKSRKGCQIARLLPGVPPVCPCTMHTNCITISQGKHGNIFKERQEPNGRNA